MPKDIYTLAIETSCDETACAILKNGRQVVFSTVYTQIELHQEFGGVVPEVASRNHLDKISQIIDACLNGANMTIEDVDHIAVTYGPGLVGALLVGLSTAKAIAFAAEKPLVAVNHIEGHIAANYIAHQDLEPPFVGLIVSGGHTHLVEVLDYTTFKIIGRTRDDAAGEAFDKVARTLGLGYPGGPEIDRLSKIGNPKAIDFPRAMLESGSLDFSFSGLKSAVLNYLNSMKMKNIEVSKEDVAASFQASVVEILAIKAMDALRTTAYDKLVLAGGVAANSALRSKLQSLQSSPEGPDFKLYYPPLSLCTDNAEMIASAGYYNALNNEYANMYINAVPNLKIGSKMGR